MLNRETQALLIGTAFGVMIGAYAILTTYKYLPSPLDLFSRAEAECVQSHMHADYKSNGSNQQSNEKSVSMPEGQPGELAKESESDKHKWECLIAKYTGSLRD